MALLEPFRNKRHLCWGKRPIFAHRERFAEPAGEGSTQLVLSDRPGRFWRWLRQLSRGSSGAPFISAGGRLWGEGLSQDWNIRVKSSSCAGARARSFCHWDPGLGVAMAGGSRGGGDAPAAPWKLHVWFVPACKMLGVGFGWAKQSTPGGCGSCCLPQLGAAGPGPVPPVVPTELPRWLFPPATDSGSWFGEKWNEFGGFRLGRRSPLAR